MTFLSDTPADDVTHTRFSPPAHHLKIILNEKHAKANNTLSSIFAIQIPLNNSVLGAASAAIFNNVFIVSESHMQVHLGKSVYLLNTAQNITIILYTISQKHAPLYLYRRRRSDRQKNLAIACGHKY